MARCGCAGSSCECTLQGAGLTTVTGTGSTASPFVVSTQAILSGGETASLLVDVDGTGNTTDEWIVTGDVKVADDNVCLAGNLLREGTTGLCVPISLEGGNQVRKGSDGGVFVPAPEGSIPDPGDPGSGLSDVIVEAGIVTGDGVVTWRWGIDQFGRGYFDDVDGAVQGEQAALAVGQDGRFHLVEVNVL